MQIPRKEFNTWLEALRSGKYKQSERALQTETGYCLLGVGCKVLIPEDKQIVSDGKLEGGLPISQPASPKYG